MPKEIKHQAPPPITLDSQVLSFVVTRANEKQLLQTTWLEDPQEEKENQE